MQKVSINISYGVDIPIFTDFHDMCVVIYMRLTQNLNMVLFQRASSLSSSIWINPFSKNVMFRP